MRGAVAFALVCIVGLAAQSLAQQYDILPGVEFLGRGTFSAPPRFSVAQISNLIIWDIILSQECDPRG
jgi:hypothetical protein